MTDAILFKDEGGMGPVYVRRADVVSNYDDNPDHVFLGRVQAQWFSRADAEAIADKEGLPFVEA